MDTKEKLEKLLGELNLYEFEIFSFNDITKEIDLFVLIDYANELLDNPNYEFEKYLKERCAFYYDKAIHSRLTLAPTIRANFKSLNFIDYKDDDFEFGVKFPSKVPNFKEEKELETKFIDLTKAFLIRVLGEV
mgnify:CR=1 FL=1